MISFASASQIMRTSHDLLEWPWQQRNFTPSGDNVLCKQSVDMSHMRSKCSFVLMSLAHNVTTVDVSQPANLMCAYCIRIE